MTNAETVAVLNQVLQLQYRSLPRYLVYGSPWTHANGADGQTRDALENIVHDQQRLTERLAELILDHRGSPDVGDFPMEFTDLHFLSLDYLLRELVYYQRQDIASLERCAADLSTAAAEAQAIVEEGLGSERAHLEVLEQLAKQPA